MNASLGISCKTNWTESVQKYLHKIKQEKYDSIYKAAPFGLLSLWANCIRLEINTEKNQLTNRQTDKQTERQTQHILNPNVLNLDTIYVFFLSHLANKLGARF